MKKIKLGLKSISKPDDHLIFHFKIHTWSETPPKKKILGGSKVGKFRRDDGNPKTMLQSRFGKYWRRNGSNFGWQIISLP